MADKEKPSILTLRQQQAGVAAPLSVQLGTAPIQQSVSCKLKLFVHPCREFAEETMGLFGGCEVNGSSVAACSRQMHTQLIQRQHVLKVVHQLKKVHTFLSFVFTLHLQAHFFNDATSSSHAPSLVQTFQQTL